MGRTKSEWCSPLSDRSKSAEFWEDQMVRAEVGPFSARTRCSRPHSRRLQFSWSNSPDRYLHRPLPPNPLYAKNEVLFTSSGPHFHPLSLILPSLLLSASTSQWRATTLAVQHNGPLPWQLPAAGVRGLSWQAALLDSSFTTSSITLYKGRN